MHGIPPPAVGAGWRGPRTTRRYRGDGLRRPRRGQAAQPPSYLAAAPASLLPRRPPAQLPHWPARPPVRGGRGGDTASGWPSPPSFRRDRPRPQESREGAAAGSRHAGAAGPEASARLRAPSEGAGLCCGSGKAEAPGSPGDTGLVPGHQPGDKSNPPGLYPVPSRFPGTAEDRHCSPLINGEGRTSDSLQSPTTREQPASKKRL